MELAGVPAAEQAKRCRDADAGGASGIYEKKNTRRIYRAA